MTDMDLTGLRLSEAAELIARRAITPLDLTQAHLERIASLDSHLNCFITLTADLALQQAHQAGQALRRLGQPPSPLFGLPIGLKDLYETQGVRTTAGSTFFADYIPAADSAVVAKLKSCGAILLGKLNMHEIALGVTNVNPHYGACRNPWALERVSGGSSGGSAAALATCLCLGALGSDTGGSIRIPAALCGIVGLKPTYGAVSLRGVMPLSWNLDHAGPMARRVRDVAILLQSIVGYDPSDPYSLQGKAENYTAQISEGVRGWRVALATGDFFEGIDSEVWGAVQQASQVFEGLGARVERVELPFARQAALANGQMVVAEAAFIHRERLQNQPEMFGADVLARLQSGAALGQPEYIQARRTQSLLRREFERFFDHFDLLLTPTTPIPAPLIEGPDAVEQARLLTRFTAPFNLTGLPAISLPCGFSSQGLPIGLQIIARPWAEAALLRAAYAYEQVTDWHTRTPNL
ncbi:MAG: amidase [Anaerolineales bacterium]|nr:amidase [Anaerolineales bacterium]